MTRDALVQALVTDPAVAQFSDPVLGQTFDIGAYTVRRVRKGLEARGAIAAVTLRRCADGIERNVTLIGKRSRFGRTSE